MYFITFEFDWWNVIFACLCLVSLWISACRSHAAVRYIRGYRMCSTGISKHGHKHQNSSPHTSSLFVSSSAYTQAVNAFLDNGASINRKYHVSFFVWHYCQLVYGWVWKKIVLKCFESVQKVRESQRWELNHPKALCSSGLGLGHSHQMQDF